MLELEVGRAEEKVGVKRDGPWLLYKGTAYRTPPPKPENLPVPKESSQWDCWVIHARIEEESRNKGMPSLLRQDVPIKATPRNMEPQDKKWFKIMTGW